METISPARYLFICLFLLAASCTTEKDCEKIFEIPTETGHLMDIAPLMDVPEFKELLEKYPGRIQVSSVYHSPDMINFHANQFYKGISMLDETISGYVYGGVTSISGVIPDTIPVSPIPTIPINQAIKEARQVRQFNGNCMSFQLCFINMARFTHDTVVDYRLTWKVQDKNGFPFVNIDAHTGKVLLADGFLALMEPGSRVHMFDRRRYHSRRLFL